MVTVVDATIPAERFALGATFELVPDAAFDAVRAVTHRTGQVMPYLWATAPDVDRLPAALEEDPTTTDVEQLSESENRCLFGVRWTGDIRLTVHALVEEHGVLVDVHGEDGRWTFRVIFRDRADVSATYECCRDRGVDLSIARVNGVTGSIDRSQSGLSEEQYAAITAAFEGDYYGVPRGVTLEELADELAVSHQALSERLRRGHQALIANALDVSSASAGMEQ